MTKPVLAIDLDEVLGQFVVGLANFHNEAYGTSLKLMDFHSYTFMDVWGGTLEETQSKVNAFFKSGHFENLELVPGAIDALTCLSESFDLVLVTARQHVIEEATTNWINRHFPGLFKRLMFGNHWGSSGHKRTKLDMCKEVQARALVDDSLKYALECATELERVVLFDHSGQYGWNKTSSSLPANVKRVHSWPEAIEELKNLL
eukprot:GILJ01001829.1.p2 GENE.GILJ01001829.1~~GILJ01001829.1.p2  ORF type:complete len:216 (-),score=29.20 GILJ01001829.1:1688-2296(-)